MKNYLMEYSIEEVFRIGLESWVLWMEYNFDFFV